MRIKTATRALNVLGPLVVVAVVWSIFSGNGPLFVARVLTTATALLLAVGPPLIDFNESHATNPDWPPHARFHVVWQVLAQSATGLLAVALLWLWPSTQSLWLAMGLNYIWLFCFYFAMASMSLYEGSLADPRGVPPIEVSLFGKVAVIDRNLAVVSILSVVNTAAAVLVFRS